MPGCNNMAQSHATYNAKKAMPRKNVQVKMAQAKMAQKKRSAFRAQEKEAQKKVAQAKMAQRKVEVHRSTFRAQKKVVQKKYAQKTMEQKKVAKKVQRSPVRARKTNPPKKLKVALYARTSSAANAAGHSTMRQLQAAASVLQGTSVQRSHLKVDKVAEVISGMLPLAERTKLQKLLSGEFDTVIVESQRALARGVHAAEEVYQTAKKNNVNILVNDMPTLYKLDATPAESFIRRVMASVSEFERDTIVARLQAGLDAKRTATKRKTQMGEPKVQGRKTLLERCGVLPSSPLMRQLKAAIKQHENSEFGWRPLAKKVKQILKIHKVPSIEVVRRMVHELK